MKVLMRFDPFREFDRLSQQLFTRGALGPGWMPIGAVKRGDSVHVSLDLPGVDPSSIELLAEKGVLTIKAERHYTPAGGSRYWWPSVPRARSPGSCSYPTASASTTSRPTT